MVSKLFMIDFFPCSIGRCALCVSMKRGGAKLPRAGQLDLCGERRLHCVRGLKDAVVLETATA